MASDEKESDLYDKVRDWVESDDGLRCHTTWKNKGHSEARPDVTGIRHAGGHLRGDFELITIEVKKSSGRFLVSAGQAAAYGVFADRAYLCCQQGDKSFDDDDIDIASHLGIGLVEINERKEVSKVLAAPIQRPIPRKRQEFLASLGWVVCQICGVPFPAFSASPVREAGTAGDRNKTSEGLVRGDIKNLSYAVKSERGYVWWLWNWSKGLQRLDAADRGSDRRHICRDCVAGLFWDLDPPEDDED